MTDALRSTVIRALDAAGFSHRTRGPFLEVDVPARFRPQFQRRSRLELSFNATAWDPTHEVELIVPGCAFLDNLEDVLRQLGASRGVWVGGDLSANEALGSVWVERFKIYGGKLQNTESAFRADQYLRFVYEVRLPGPPPRTELIPVVWHARTGKALEPQEAGRLLDLQWYAAEELRGVVNARLPPVSEQDRQRARSTCDKTLQHRLGPVLSSTQKVLSERLSEERRHLEEDKRARLSEAKSKEEQDQITAEHDRRIDLIQKQEDEAYRAKVGLVTRLVRLEQAPIFVYQHSRTKETVRVRPILRGRRLIDAQCAHCDVPRTKYLLAPGLDATPPLLCTTCGVNCASSTCSGVLLRKSNPVCQHCEVAKYCDLHHLPCAACNNRTCPDHLVRAHCCGRHLCPSHCGRSADGSTVYCATHGRQCTIDKRWYARSDGISCPITGLWMARQNASRAPGDARLLHPSALVTCASSGMQVARDRAEKCDADGRWHAPSELAFSARDRKKLCPEHRILTQLPPGVLIDRRQATRCQESKKICHRDEVMTCSSTGLRVHQSLLVTCDVTGKRLLSRAATAVPGDPRVLHPSAATKCGVSGRLVASDRAVPDAIVNGRLLHPEETARCELTGRIGAKRHQIRLACCRRRAILEPDQPSSMEHLLRSPSGPGWVCTEHYGRCSKGGHVVPNGDLERCATTLEPLCPQHRVYCDCHHHAQDPDYLWRTPYLQDKFCRAHERMVCDHCGWTTPSHPHHVCQWCVDSVPLSSAPDQVRQVFHRIVRPRLPWYVLSPTVVASGTARAWLFEVTTLLNGRRMFLIRGKRLFERSLPAGSWREVDG